MPLCGSSQLCVLKPTSERRGILHGAGVQGGGPVRLTNLLVWGVDLVEEHLLCRCACRCVHSSSRAHLCNLRKGRNVEERSPDQCKR